MNRDGRVVMISGGLGDIALATALAFGRRGAAIALSDLRPVEANNEQLKVLRKEKIIFSYHQTDTGDADAVAAWTAEVVKKWGRIDVAVVNAAVITQKPLAKITAGEWKADMDVNFNGAFYFAQQAANYFSANAIHGNIVFLGS